MHTNQQCIVQVQCMWTAAQLEKTWSNSSLSHPLLSLLLVAFSALAVHTLLYLCLLTEALSAFLGKARQTIPERVSVHAITEKCQNQ